MTASAIVAVNEPAHGTIAGFGPGHLNYQPDSGFSGTDTSPTSCATAHGLLATGQVTVWVDTGSSPAQNPLS